MGSNFTDEIDNLSFFENMDDLVEFPSDNDCCNGFIGSGDCNDFPSIWNEDFPEAVNIFPGTSSETASELPADISLPDHDMAGLDWYAAFMEESFSGSGNSLCDESIYLKEKSHNYPFQSSSPVSVLESSSTTSSSSSCSGEKVIPRGSQRARSKRPRPATFNPRQRIHLTSSTSSFSGTLQPFIGFGSGMPSESDNFAESGEPMRKPKLEASTMIMTTTTMEEVPKKQKKKLKFSASPPLGPMDNINDNTTAAQAQTQAVRKCLHCEITKTPQWRAGPMGPKTLCNACGVRYKSGRLFPEYRPAASPTFVPSLHSNSHKKVIEMRNKEVYNPPPTVAEAESSHRGEVVADTNPSSSSAIEYI